MHPEETDKRAAGFLDELLWCVAAKQGMEKK